MTEPLTSETRLVHREELGRLLDQWVEWLDPKRPNHLTTDMLADSLWAALARSESPSPEGLTEAWAETEAALPEGWLLVQLERTYRLSKTKPRRLVEGYWMARAHPAETPESEFGLGDTPAAALRALAARLRSSADSGTEGT